MKLVRVYDANSKLLPKLKKSKKMPDNFDNIYRDEGIVVTFRSPKNEKYYTKELRNLGVYFVATGDVAQIFNEDGKFLGETTIDSKKEMFDIEILLNSIAIETATRLMNGKAKFLNNIPNEVFGGYVHGYDFARMVKEELVNYVTMLASSEELEEAKKLRKIAKLSGDLVDKRAKVANKKLRKEDEKSMEYASIMCKISEKSRKKIGREL